jgi:hypothetical protein
VILGSRLSLQRTTPVIESVSRQLRAPLRGEEIRASLIMYPVLLVVIQQASCFVAWINITGLCPLPRQMEPSTSGSGTDMDMADA